MLTTFILAMAASAASPAGVAVETDPRKMTQAQIREHNAKYQPKDPDYIRCVKSQDTGSLVRKRFSCRTNAQWNHADRVGNDNARETYEAMTSKAWNQNP